MDMTKVLSELNVDDVVRYAHDMFNFDLFDFQKNILRDICAGKNVRTARGIGRTRLIYLLAFYCANKYRDLSLMIHIAKKLEYNNYDTQPDAVYPYDYCIKTGLGTLELYEDMKALLPKEAFAREFECKGSEGVSNGQPI